MEDKPHIKFVTDLARALVNNPDQVEVEDKMDERGILIQLWVDKEDLGRIIGKGGDGANAIRTLLRTLGTKNNAHYGFKVDTRYSVK
jgi:predicted RNA-binding protein YlqC (UPF0109 family)